MLSVSDKGNGQTGLVQLRQAGATKLLFPDTATGASEAILVNTAGGVTGGDVFELDVDVGKAADLTLTTQAAERAYRAQPGEVGRISTKVTVQTGGRLDWVPQELIIYNGAALRRRLEIDLAADAQLLMVEPLVFGRAAMGETLTDISLFDRITIRRDGAPLYLDALDLRGNAVSRLARAAVAAGAGAMASVVLVRADADALLTPVRRALPVTAGASLLAEDMLVIRQLAEDSFLLRKHLVPVLELLSKRKLPTSWRL